jgi:hypothetical protein
MIMKIQKYWITALGLTIALAAGMYASAQTQTDQKVAAATQQVFVTSPTGAKNLQSGGSTFTFVSSEMGFETKVIKGAPFSADTVTEFIQTLGNGQRIYRKSTAFMCRDSEGRTRREQGINVIGAYASSEPERKTIMINDPVAGVMYILNPDEHTAAKVQISLSALSEKGMISGRVTVSVKQVIIDGVNTGGVSVSRRATAETGKETQVVTTVKAESGSNTRKESLGTQVIEGVQAEGTRIVETIPAGAIGNDTPIEIVSETWVSPELGVIVKSIHSDPRSGDNVYQLTNIRRAEPDPSLFQVPPDYTIKQGPSIQQSIQIKKKEDK